MNENPYMSPGEPSASESVVDVNEELSFADYLNQVRDDRQKWSRRCWWIGCPAILVGFLCFNMSQTVYPNHNLGVVIVLLDVASIFLLAFGASMIVFGPISWFWFRQKS